MSRTVWLRITVALVILAGLALAVVFANRFGEDPRIGSSPLVGKPAPDVTVEIFDGGGPLPLADTAGTVTVVNFWAPWCVPCRTEHGALLQAAARYEGEVTIVGVAYQSEDDAIDAYLDELGRGYTIATDPGSRAAIRFGVRGVPETFFIGRDGTVAAKVSGPVDLGLLTSTIDALLAGDEVDSVETGDVQVTP